MGWEDTVPEPPAPAIQLTTQEEKHIKNTASWMLTADVMLMILLI